MANKNKKAFTLIEILVVLLVLGILMTIGISVGTSLMKKQDIKKTKQTMEMIKSACITYAKHNNGVYPTNLSKLRSTLVHEDIRDDIRNIPQDANYFIDAWENQIKIVNGKLISTGPNGTIEYNTTTGNPNSGSDDIVMFVHKK